MTRLLPPLLVFAALLACGALGVVIGLIAEGVLRWPT